MSQRLTQAINWRAPVAEATDLPILSNRIGDVRYVITQNILYVWTSSGWRSPAMGESTSGHDLALLSSGPGGIAAYTLGARTAAGVIPADSSNLLHMGNIVGITIESAAANQNVMTQVAGLVKFPTSVFGTLRGPVMVGVGGTISTTIQPGSVFMQHAGLVVAPDELALQLATGTTVIL